MNDVNLVFDILSHSVTQVPLHTFFMHECAARDIFSLELDTMNK